MKNLLITIVALITINTLTSAQSDKTDFRGSSWGDSFFHVKSNEKAKQIQIGEIANTTDDVLLYEDKLAASDVTVVYQFSDNDKLINGHYFFTKKYSDPQLYLHEYRKFKKLLTSKYGNPTVDEEEWSANTTPFAKENYGQAICDGYLDLIAVWSTESSIIKIVLLTLNDHPSLQIHYTTKSLDELENMEDLKKALPML
jgi:hypothetical protein